MKKLNEREIYDNAIDLYIRSKKLESKVKKEYKEIVDLVEKYPEDKIESMSWAEKEFFFQEADRLNNLLNEDVEKLKKLDEDFEDIRKYINKFYNKELIREFPPLNIDNLTEAEDPADYWKKL